MGTAVGSPGPVTSLSLSRLLSCQPSPLRSGHQSVTRHSVMSSSTSPRTTHNTVSEGSVSLVTLMSFLHAHYVACLAMGYSCSFDINLTCYFSSVMRNVTTLEWMFSVVFSAICFAGALGLICQHGGQGVNDCGNNICMCYCSIREHDLVHRFVD